MAKTLVGVFEDSTTAQRVVTEIQATGVLGNHARLVSNREGPSGSDASGENLGTRIKNWFSSLFEDEQDRSHADTYAEAWRRGHYLVVADVDDSSVERVVDIMNRAGAIDVQRRSEEWKQSGYSGTFDESAEPYSVDQFEQERGTYGDRTTASASSDQSIPVVQEELAVGKRVVQRGGVRVHSYVEERPVEQIVRLRDERVNVQRIPVNRAADASDLAFKDRTIEVTASGEEPVIEKRARVVEEVVVNKDVTEREQKIEETVRRRDVRVESVPVQGQAQPLRQSNY